MIYAYIYGIISFIATLLVCDWLIRYLKRIKLEVKDQNKQNKPLIPISGGLAVLVGMFSGLLIFIFTRTFFKGKYDLILNNNNLVILFAAMISLFIITLVGFLDDLVIRDDKESSSGLRQWQKPLLTITAAIPLMVIHAGTARMGLPFFGVIELGLLYPLIFIPIGVMGAANMVNMLAGFNGMETGMGIIYTASLGLYAFTNQRDIAALIALVACASLIAFYYYNRYPAKILPGDSLTYLLGGVIAIIAILGNIERAALIISIPFFIEFILKARSKFKANSYGYYKNGKIQSTYDKIYSIPHLLTIKGKYTEKQITYFMITIELFFSMLIWLI